MSANRAAARCYAAILWLYPRRFRDDYRSDMELLFREQCADEPLWRVSSRAVLDLALTIPTQHLETRMRSTPTPLVPLLFTALAVGGALLAIASGSEPGGAVIGLFIAVAAGSLAALAWRRAAPVRTEVASRTWWMLLVCGVALVAVVIVAAGAGAEAWELMMASILAAFTLIGSGLVLGTAQAVRRIRQNNHVT